MNKPRYSYELQDWAEQQTDGPGRIFSQLKELYCIAQDSATLGLLDAAANECKKTMEKENY